MLRGRQVKSFDIIRCVSFSLLVLLLAASCTVPKRYQKNKPFVYKTNITLQTNLSGGEKLALKEGLQNQLDDSLKVRTVLAVRAVPPFLYNRLSRPPVFDTLYIGRSKTFMNALLNAQGYFSPIINDTFTIDTVRDQQRVTVRFDVVTGKVLRLDSIGYALQTPELQQLANDNKEESLLKSGDPYSLQNVSGELDRLLHIYRNNGYFKITKEDLFAEHDTVVAALIDPTLDPFEQIRLLDSLQKKRENPTINVVIKQRVPKDSTHLNKYYFNNIAVYPDMNILLDTGSRFRFSSVYDNFRFRHNSRRFKIPFLARNIFIRKGDLYQVDNYFKTINTFTNLGAWQQVDIDVREHPDSLGLLNANIKLYPARKQSLNIDFETSRNASDVLTTGSLFGIGLNLGLNNRNAFRESIQTSSSVRFGVELGTNIVQTIQTSFSHNIYIPRFILPFRVRSEKNMISPRTIVNFNLAYTNRRDFFEVRSVNASWGYEWTKRNHTWQYIPLNFEFTDVGATDSLRKLQARIPSLEFAFNNGLIISQVLTYATARSVGKHKTLFRARMEESGAIFGLIKNLDRGDLNRFIKGDVEYKYFIENKKSTWAFRIFGGYGYAYGRSGDSTETSLPFFKAYFGGGPYSMRAWRVRQLGLGSNIFYDTAAVGSLDRFGDIKLEANIEYRFDIGRIFGIKVQSALFSDIGNVWLRETQNDPNLVNANFSFSRLYKDLAVAGGTSLRLDFDFFLIRFDWAYKLKNPFYSDINNGWFQKISLGDGQFQLGIGYPF
jgi:outer membrane protein insertion porin family